MSDPDTLPLPLGDRADPSPVVAAGPGPGDPPAGVPTSTTVPGRIRAGGRPGPVRTAAAVRTLAGVLSAGSVVVGLVLVLSPWWAPLVLAGSGLDRAAGAAPGRSVPQLVAGLLGEAVRLLSRRWRPAARLAAASGVVVLCLAALAWGWWR
ncbi:hypothetical protein [Nakamurella endophytica]|uniref:Uncharacterized protein n=1 Tax=Nakamurella endophytica TaxID=1748367 RepID=A0A917SST4_9ACTN|nr:hypothetical protein [Nakamurella endophytica]GGL95749.1 hypothetical protein GCM10011594_14270 [Nakamurella endophytica]